MIKLITSEIKDRFKEMNLIVDDRDDEGAYGTFFICGDKKIFESREYNDFIEIIKQKYPLPRAYFVCNQN